MSGLTVPPDCPKTCPLQMPFELLSQKTLYETDNLHKDLHRLKDTVNGNGKTGLVERMQKVEMQSEHVNTELSEIKTAVQKMQEAAENWKARLFQAAIQIAAGGGGVLALLELLGK